MRWLTLLLCLVLLPGCAVPSALTDALAERESCHYIFGFIGPFMMIRTITATGGAIIEDCEALR